MCVEAGRKVVMVSIDWHLHSIQQVALDGILKPENCQKLCERRNPIVLEVWILVMLLSMKVHKLIKGEVLLVTFTPEGLELRIALPLDTTCWPPRRTACRVLYTDCPFLVLLNFCMRPTSRTCPSKHEWHCKSWQYWPGNWAQKAPCSPGSQV